MAEGSEPAWWMQPACWLRLCPFRYHEDQGGVGGRCVRCNRISGYVTREELRAYADREIAKRAARAGGPLAGWPTDDPPPAAVSPAIALSRLREATERATRWRDQELVLGTADVKMLLAEMERLQSGLNQLGRNSNEEWTRRHAKEVLDNGA